MVTTKTLAPRARAYILAVIVGGTALGGLLAARAPVRAADLAPLAVFCAFGVLATALDITRRSTTHSRLSYQIGSSFAYPLLVLVEPAATCLVFVLTTLADKLLHRRSWITTGFNVGQLLTGCAAAIGVQHALDPDFAGLDVKEPRSIGAAVASLVVFAVLNHLLTRGVVSLVNATPLLAWDRFSRRGALNEALCVVSGLCMAVLWQTRPWLVLLGAIPVWILGYMIATLSRRESALETREDELRTLQGLGLKIGAELDLDRLRDSALAVAAEAVGAAGGLLGTVEDGRRELIARAWRGAVVPCREPIALRGLPRQVLEHGRVALVPGRDLASRCPGLDLPEAAGLLVAPLGLARDRASLLVLYHGADRVPFGEDDRRRLETLVPFVNVALSNARLFAERRALQAQLLQAEKMSALGVLVAGVAHELNNPLTSVLGYAELLGSGESDPRRKDKLVKIGNEARRAAAIVQDLRTFSREGESRKRPVDLNRVVAQVLEARREELLERGIAVASSLAEGLPAVRADAARLQQVLLQLLANAEAAVGEVDRPGSIEIETLDDGERVVLAVQDNGPGVRPEHLDRIFLPFFTTRVVGHGPGLGLSICYGIVKDHGGRIRVLSPPGRGARFVVELPRAAAGQAGSSGGAGERSAAGA